MFGIDRTPNVDDDVVVPRRGRHDDAVDALAVAAESLGLAPRSGSDGDRAADLVVVLPGGAAMSVQVESASLVTADSVSGQLRRWSERSPGGVTGVVVADRITAPARDELTRAGWSWLDLRGHLRLVGPGLLVDTAVRAPARPSAERPAIRGQVGLELAALLLLDPTRRVGVRSAAATVSRAASSVSEALADLRAAALVDDKNRPAVPGLFWELAERWESPGQDVASIPAPNRGRDNAALGIGLDDIETRTGWALTDTLAAAAYGAPVSTRADHPPDFYVPDQSTLRRAVRLLGPAVTSVSRAGRVRVAPVPMACTRRIDATQWSDQHWPLAHPLFVALDLARDPGRGREIVDGWTPDKPWHRVW